MPNVKPNSADGLLTSKKWQRAIADSGLSRVCKAFCNALMVSADYRTGECRVSMATLADRAGYCVRALQRSARHLESLGVLEYPQGRRGGCRVDGRGITTSFKLVFDRIPKTKGDFCTPFKGDNGDRQGRTDGVPRVTSATTKGVQNTPEETLAEQTSKRNTPHNNTAVVVGGVLPRGASAVAEDNRTESRAHAIAELVSFGVTASMARKLAAEFDPDVIDTGIEWVGEHGEMADNPAGLLVTILRDGTAQAEFDAQVLDQQRRDEAVLASRRTEALKEGVAWLRAHWKPSWEKNNPLDERLRAIEARYPTMIDLAYSGLVTDHELFSQTDPERWLELFKRIYEHCTAVQRSTN